MSPLSSDLPTRGAALAGAVLLVVGAAATVPAAAADPPEPRVFSAVRADVPAASSLIDSATAAVRSRVPDVPGLVQVEVLRGGEAEAYGTTSVTAPEGVHSTGHGWLFLATYDETGWRVEVDTADGFADLVASSTLLTDRERRLLTRYATAAPRTEARTGLMLPWQKGASWTYAGGPHGFAALPDEPRSSLDLAAGGGGRVLAAGRGVAAAMCPSGGYRGWIRVVHPNGLSTDYYHLVDNVTPDGDAVRRGAFLGYEGTDVSCGGSAAAPHVHLTLGQRTLGGGGDFLPIEGRKIGGWTFWAGAAQYEGTATHGGTTAGIGDELRNYGGKGGGGGDDPPTHAEVWSDGDRVNLRAGPGTDYEIVGSKADGAPVKIDCTARGTWVEGMDGPTNLWDRLTNGKWISDGFVYTGSSEPVEEDCSA